MVALHLISDSTGETVSALAKSLIGFFGKDRFTHTYIWPLVLSDATLDDVLEKVMKRPGVLLCTITNQAHLARIQSVGLASGSITLEPLKQMTELISKFLSVEPTSGVGRQHAVDERYLEMMNAIEFTLSHDDGQGLCDLQDSQIVLVGPSRTSKTPTSMYLAYKGFRVANIPYIASANCDWVNLLANKVVIGLVVDGHALRAIRMERLKEAGVSLAQSYADLESIELELMSFRRLCMDRGWSVVDATRKSVEEVAAHVIRTYFSQIGSISK